MRLGYIKGRTTSIDQLDHNAYDNVDKMYIDNAGEHIALKELQAYCRRGDVIIVRDIRDLCETAGEFVELLLAEEMDLECCRYLSDYYFEAEGAWYPWEG